MPSTRSTGANRRNTPEVADLCARPAIGRQRERYQRASRSQQGRLGRKCPGSHTSGCMALLGVRSRPQSDRRRARPLRRQGVPPLWRPRSAPSLRASIPTKPRRPGHARCLARGRWHQRPRWWLGRFSACEYSRSAYQPSVPERSVSTPGGRVSRPRASGLHGIVPTPSSRQRGSISRSSSRASRL